ncbi:Asp23/Gls24 family envelope stress response protein [Microbacterium sp. SD291]|uniref:Asp23/Gls24 family envelope stress response protein n=1 Tax=Microbacterium sp. SD291 TaxID=2782007 RepID=UPI001A9782CC|nr:Asp23/Gls24 family envelope stress response protein [Microbacterium sp. SD291]MBO0981916.1 Asp23/Gls24 family envelope stress response protein [Microbacterium sp. SD291]
MTDDHELHRLGLERADLDGHTIEELADYLDAGRSPADASIDGSAGCQLALDALERLHGLTGRLIAADAAAQGAVDESWVDRVLSGIALDARAGRRIPFASDPDEDLAITEGAVRGLIRGAENALPGVLVGRCRLDGDVTLPGEPIRIGLDASVPYGEPITRLAERLRAEVDDRLRTHTELNVVEIDIMVRDIRAPWSGGHTQGQEGAE